MVSENDDFDGADGGKLRKMLEDALKEKKALAEKVADFESKARTQSVEKALSEKGLNPKLAKFVPADDAADPARLDAWVKDNAELFGTPNPPTEETGGETSVSPEGQAAHTAIQNVSANGAHAVSDVSAIQARIKAAKNPAELDAIMAQFS